MDPKELSRSIKAFLHDEGIFHIGILDASDTTHPPENAKSVVVIANSVAHDPYLDYWGVKGGTPSNAKLMELSKRFRKWIKEMGVKVKRVKYKPEIGGIFMKDAAHKSGMGFIGKNNMLIVPEFGPRVRLGALAIEEYCEPTPKSDYNPCENCEEHCQSACPQSAFESGKYDRARCQIQMDICEEVAEDLVVYCRKCEISCPVGIDKCSENKK